MSVSLKQTENAENLKSSLEVRHLWHHLEGAKPVILQMRKARPREYLPHLPIRWVSWWAAAGRWLLSIGPALGTGSQGLACSWVGHWPPPSSPLADEMAPYTYTLLPVAVCGCRDYHQAQLTRANFLTITRIQEGWVLFSLLKVNKQIIKSKQDRLLWNNWLTISCLGSLDSHPLPECLWRARLSSHMTFKPWHLQVTLHFSSFHWWHGLLQ
jgi:hypothetical protein